MAFVQFNGEHIGCFEFESNSTFVVDFRLHTQFKPAIENMITIIISFYAVSRYHAKKCIESACNGDDIEQKHVPLLLNAISFSISLFIGMSIWLWCVHVGRTFNLHTYSDGDHNPISDPEQIHKQ